MPPGVVMRLLPLIAAALSTAAVLGAQPAPPAQDAKPTLSDQVREPGKQRDAEGWRKAEDAAPKTGDAASPRGDGKGFTVDTGTKIPLSMINSVSTKHAAEGDRVYLETVFPILVSGKIVIPPGSYVAGTVTQVKRPGRVKGRGELFVRFDSLTLPNGVTRDFRARMSSMDGRAAEDFDRVEGKVKSEGNKADDARNVGEAAA